jgi:hypothetical protein
MKTLTFNSLRSMLSAEGLAHSSDLARYVLDTLTKDGFEALPAAEKGKNFSPNALQRTLRGFLSPEEHGALMLFLLEKKQVAPQWFSENEIKTWHSCRVKFQILRYSAEGLQPTLPDNPGVNKDDKDVRLDFYEGVLGMVCNRFGVPARPPHYAELVSHIANNL